MTVTGQARMLAALAGSQFPLGAPHDGSTNFAVASSRSHHTVPVRRLRRPEASG